MWNWYQSLFWISTYTIGYDSKDFTYITLSSLYVSLCALLASRSLSTPFSSVHTSSIPLIMSFEIIFKDSIYPSSLWLPIFAPSLSINFLCFFLQPYVDCPGCPVRPPPCISFLFPQVPLSLWRAFHPRSLLLLPLGSLYVHYRFVCSFPPCKDTAPPEGWGLSEGQTSDGHAGRYWRWTAMLRGSSWWSVAWIYLPSDPVTVHRILSEGKQREE